MNRLLPRQRAAMALAIAFMVGTVGVAFAGPEFPPGGNPNVTLDVSPNDGDNLPSPANITVTGAGFGNTVSGNIRQCWFDPNAQFDVCSNPLARFTSNASGVFSTTVTVSSTFTGLNAQGQPIQINCAQVNCFVQAVSDTGQFQSTHHISFAGGTTTTMGPTTTTTVVGPTTTGVPGTTTTTLGQGQCAQLRAARGAFNAQIDQLIAAINAANLSAQQRNAVLAQLAAVRAQGNAQIDQALARSNCTGNATA